MRYIKIDIKEKIDEYVIRILEQSHRGDLFSERGEIFKSSNGFKLMSRACICPCIKENLLYVRGTDYESDLDSVTIKKCETYKTYLSPYIKMLKEAVNEYNEYRFDRISIKRKT